MYCIRCGKQIEDGSRFCLHCGAQQIQVADTLKETGVSLQKPEGTVREATQQTNAAPLYPPKPPVTPPSPTPQTPQPYGTPQYVPPQRNAPSSAGTSPPAPQAASAFQTQQYVPPQRNAVPPAGPTPQTQPPYGAPQYAQRKNEAPQQGTPQSETGANSKPKLPLPAKIAIGVVALLLVVCYGLPFLKEYGPAIFGILLVLGMIFSLTIGTKEEKIEARKTIIKLGVLIIVAGVVAIVIVSKPEFIMDIFEPGAEVRNGYLTIYSDEVTVGEAFENYFRNGEWDAYEKNGHRYVVFTGTMPDSGDHTEVEFTFAVSDETFSIDHMEMDGEVQNEFVVAIALAAIYNESS